MSAEFGTTQAPQFFLNADARGGVAAGKQSYTIAEAANQLIRGEPGWSGAFGTPATVSYGFRANSPATMPEDTSGFSRFNSAQIAQTELALAGWSDAANIRFVRAGFGTSGESAYSDQATMLFGNYAAGQSTASAFGYYPGSTSSGSASGDVWININSGSNAAPSTGNYGAMVLTHEIGHAIGLAHPAEYDSGDSASYAASAIYYEDSRQYTVMSYFGEGNTGAYFGGRYAASPLLDDIAAAQRMYGANMATRAGDTVYGFNSNAGRPWFEASGASSKLVFAVWDAGGSDVFDFSGFSNQQIIDLRAGYFSNVGGLTGNVAVAAGATIESAIGGSGADTMNGNAVGNALFGGTGDDRLVGDGGSDYLRGEQGNDYMLGGAAFDDMHGNMGADTMYGGDGDDWVVGGQNNDWLTGEIGADLVYANMGDDTAYGGMGDDIIRGGQNNDILYGEAGADWISGDRGDDVIYGGAGADSFHTWGLGDLDRIMDFNRAEGDRVLVSEGSTYSVAQVGADTVITVGGAAQMVLTGVNAAGLTEGWIVAY